MIKRTLTAILPVAALAGFAQAGIQTTDGNFTPITGAVTYGEVGQLDPTTGGGLIGTGPSYPNSGGNTYQQAGSQIDLYWVNGDSNNPLIFNFTGQYRDILAFPGIDHGPTPEEGLEFVLWGFDFQTGGWEEGKIKAIYQDGASLSSPYDDYTSLWTFSRSYSRFMVHQGDHLDPHYGSDDFEVDGLAAPAAVPEPTSIAVLGMGVAALLRRKKK